MRTRAASAVMLTFALTRASASCGQTLLPHMRICAVEVERLAVEHRIDDTANIQSVSVDEKVLDKKGIAAG